MIEMHFFKKAKEIAILSPNRRDELPIPPILNLFYYISDWMQTVPVICDDMQKESRSVYAIFRDFAFVVEDFWQMYGMAIAALSARWHIDVFGTALSAQETVWMTVEQRKNRSLVMQRTVSGNPAETLQSMCLRVECDTSDQAEQLRTILQAADWKKGIVAVAWKYEDFLNEHATACLEQNSCFCYAAVREDFSTEDCLNALCFTQKVELWLSFLKDAFPYVEFEWLYQEILSDTLDNWTEWELALYTAMKRLGYTVQVAEHGFELYDGAGKRCYFNFDSREYAQRAFLKMLFPVNL